MTKDTDTIYDLRKQLLSNGFTPLPNRDKRCFLERWPSVEVTDAALQNWQRKVRRFSATGLRVENGLAVIDIDVDHPIMEKLAVALEKVVPEGYLLRRGKGHKEAWFVRTAEPFTRIFTRRWTAPGTTADEGTCCVEIFGGATPRQFGAFGPHTVDDDGNVLVSYQWDGPSPADTRLDQLPVLTKEQFYEVANAAEQTLLDEGFTVVERSTRGESEASRVFDLKEDTRFDLHTGEDGVLLRDVEQRLKGGAHLRCSASWLEGSSAVNRSRCILGLSRYGYLTVWESASGVTHMEERHKPIDRTAALDRAAERLKELSDKAKRTYDVTEGASATAAKIRATYAYCPQQQKSVVPLWAGTLDDGVTLPAFRQSFLPYCEIEIGPRGGEKKINPVDVWLCDPKRTQVAGLRMRPDKPRPTYEEDDELWVNVYAPPAHEAEGGDPDGGIALIAQLLPDETERHWFTQWLAFKASAPQVPGPAVIMVAPNRFGTGRGTLGNLLEKVFGAAYMRTIPFHIFAGQTYQSQYNDWAVQSVMVMVNESSNTEGNLSTYRTKANTYEHLKEQIDPRPRRVHVVRKGENAYMAWTFASFLIATNNRDALPLPPDDRRFAVLSNGEPREAAFWEWINEWMADDANVAAFVRWLQAYDLEGYSPYAPPLWTEAKQTMIDMGATDLDHAFKQAVAEAPGNLFTVEQVTERMRAIRTQYDYEFPDSWQAIAKRLVQNRMARIGKHEGRNWLLPVGGRQLPVYAVNEGIARLWTDEPPADVLAELAKNATTAAAPGQVLTSLFGKGETG